MASSIVTSTAEKLRGLLVDEAKYLYQVSEKTKSLQVELEWMVCFLEDADNREYQEKIVCKWVYEIRDIAYEAEDLIERYLHEVSHHRQDGLLNTMKWLSCCVFDALTLHYVGSNIDELRDRMSNLISRMQMYGIQSVGRPERSKENNIMKEQRRTYSHTDEAPIGLEKRVKAVVGQLLENKTANVVGIDGMGGLGKTTLARKVFSDKAIKERFQNSCAWVYLSKEFDRRHIFEGILIGLRANEDKDIRDKAKKYGDDELPGKICEALKEKECLVVIDDIWYTRSWDSLKPTFESIKSSNSKILITTRNDSLAHYADETGYTYQAGKLSDEDSWELLKQKAFARREKKAATDEDTIEMGKSGREMAKHCKGLPLAIIALGGILAERRTVKQWKIVQNNISSYLMCDTTKGSEDGGVLQVLEMSFYDLPFYLKPCFLYLGSFPEDYEIQSQRLYHLWEVEGLVSGVNNGFEIEGLSLDDIAESYLNQLVQRSMVQVYKTWPNGSIKSCRVHDIMRDMCLQKCKGTNFLSIVDYNDNSNAPSGHGQRSSLGYTTLRRCSLYTADVDEPGSTQQLDKHASIRSLLIFPLGDGCRADALFKKLSKGTSKFFPLLRILDLQGVTIEELPNAFKNCIHMRYLSLRGTRVKKVPQWVFRLEYLETLDLRSGVTFSPYHDFQKLRRLRHLNLPKYMSMEGSEIIKWSDDQLRQMETLRNFTFHQCQKADLEKMVNLRIFSIGGMGHLLKEDLVLLMKSPAFSSGCLINLQTMIMVDAEIIKEEPTIMPTFRKYLKGLWIAGRIEVGDAKIFHQNMKRLGLSDCEIGEVHLRELEKLPYLETLDLNCTAINGGKMRFSEKAFPQLVYLDLYDMKELEECVGYPSVSRPTSIV